MDRPDDRKLPDDFAALPAMPTQAELETVIAADDAAVAAGQSSAIEPVLARMRDTAERVRRERQHRVDTAHRRA